MPDIMQSIEETTMTPPGSPNGGADGVDKSAHAPTQKGRGWIRGPRPEMAYECRDLDDALAAVLFEVQTHSQGLIPEEVACRLRFALGASLDYPKIRAAADEFVSKATNEPVDPDPCPGYSIAAALSNFYDSKEKLKYQRVVARAIVGAVGCADGFRYSERRAVDTSKEDGYRFAFVCRESLQNKDRGVNRRGNGEVTQESEKSTFDCKGAVRVTFSIKTLTVDVWYHHLPIHDSSFELEQTRKAYKDEAAASASQPQPDAPTPDVYPMLENPYQPQPTPTDEPPPKKKRARAKKPATTASNGPAPSSQDTQNLNTLVDALAADITNTNPPPSRSPTSPRKKKLKPSTTTPPPVDMPHENPKKATRARTGCLTCRTRRVKCDEARPDCRACAQKGRECVWPPGLQVRVADPGAAAGKEKRKRKRGGRVN